MNICSWSGRANMVAKFSLALQIRRKSGWVSNQRKLMQCGMSTSIEIMCRKFLCNLYESIVAFSVDPNRFFLFTTHLREVWRLILSRPHCFLMPVNRIESESHQYDHLMVELFSHLRNQSGSQWRNWTFEPGGKNLAEGGPLATVGRLLVNTQKKVKN